MSVARSGHVPEGVVERLPGYLNVLMQLRKEGESTVSSARLGELTGVNPAQIRRDLTHFGQFGTRGVGYDVPRLIDRVQHILGSDHSHRIVLVGAGHLGSAIAAYDGLRTRGFALAAVFDKDPDRVGGRAGDVVVRHISELPRVVAEQRVQFGVIAVPADAAQEVADLMVSAGIRVILNYSSTIVRAPGPVIVHNTDPVRELLHTLYYLARSDEMTGTAHG
ncbi:MAG TPA: redox-sensing transcriptional repressor Rex [Coriobacteriia bacterium]|nr:redox-sensing transcriptional repressor Rex [Coriobacteriia bacterium]